MNTASIVAIVTAIPAIIGAVTALIIAIRHSNNPDAHKGNNNAL